MFSTQIVYDLSKQHVRNVPTRMNKFQSIYAMKGKILTWITKLASIASPYYKNWELKIFSVVMSNEMKMFRSMKEPPRKVYLHKDW